MRCLGLINIGRKRFLGWRGSKGVFGEGLEGLALKVLLLLAWWVWDLALVYGRVGLQMQSLLNFVL